MDDKIYYKYYVCYILNISPCMNGNTVQAGTYYKKRKGVVQALLHQTIAKATFAYKCEFKEKLLLVS